MTLIFPAFLPHESVTWKRAEENYTRAEADDASKFDINAGRWGSDVLYSYLMKAVNVCCVRKARPHAHTYMHQGDFMMLLSLGALGVNQMLFS